MGSAALETVLRFDSAIPKGRQFPRLQEITANSSLLQLVLMIGNKQLSPRVKKCIFFIRSWTVLSGVILFGNISLWGKKCADISEISLLMLNAFPLWAVSLLVKFLYASIFILVEKKNQFAETLLEFHLFPSAALNLCKHWGTVWHLAPNLSFICSISYQLDSEAKKTHISKANGYGVTLKYSQNTMILTADWTGQI